MRNIFVVIELAWNRLKFNGRLSVLKDSEIEFTLISNKRHLETDLRPAGTLTIQCFVVVFIKKIYEI